MKPGVFICAFLATSPAYALWERAGEHGRVALDGSARAFGLFVHTPFPDPDRPAYFDEAVSVDRLRLMAAGELGEHFRLNLAGDVVAVIGGQGQLVETLTVGSPTQLRRWDLDADVAGRTYHLSPGIDRAVVAFVHPRFELRLGRQAIGHGAARLFPVSDVFAPFAGFALDTEYKPGVDALRATVPIGERAEAELYAVGHDDLLRGMLLARGRVTLAGVDVSAYGGMSYEEPTFALDLQGNVGDAGWYAELITRPLLGDFDRVLRTTAGLTHRFELGLTALVEAHYNGAGVSEPADFLAANARLERQVGESFLLGRWYSGVGLDYELTELFRPSFVWFQSYTDGSALLAPGFRWDLGAETVVSGGALIGLGEGFDGLLPQSEFGAAGDLVYADVRIYF